MKYSRFPRKMHFSNNGVRNSHPFWMAATHDIRPITHDDVIASKSDIGDLRRDIKLAEIGLNIICFA